MRNTVYNFFNENSSIPESGTTYSGYSGALKCLSEGVGDVAFAKDSTVAGYCGNENSADNEECSLPENDYVLLPSYGSAPSHPVMYNPEYMDAATQKKVQDALIGMNDSTEGNVILENILGTPGITATDAQVHLNSYGSLIEDIPGIKTYFNDKYDILESES